MCSWCQVTSLIGFDELIGIEVFIIFSEQSFKFDHVTDLRRK